MGGGRILDLAGVKGGREGGERILDLKKKRDGPMQIYGMKL